MHYRNDGPRHRELRARWWLRVAAGVVECARCGEVIRAGESWDLGHVDGSLEYGPEHSACNRRTKTHAAEREKWMPGDLEDLVTRRRRLGRNGGRTGRRSGALRDVPLAA